MLCYDVPGIVKSSLSTDKLANQCRFILPSSKLIGAVFRCYLLTGPSYGDSITADRAVKIDLMLNDLFPPRYRNHIVRGVVDGKESWVLDNQCLLKCKLSAYTDRATENDYIDIRGLAFRYYDQIQTYKHSLDLDHIEFFLDEVLVRESQETVTFLKCVLLPIEPSSPLQGRPII